MKNNKNDAKIINEASELEEEYKKDVNSITKDTSNE